MRALLDLVLPTSGAGCRQPSTVACADCLRPLAAAPVLAWPRPSPPGLPVPFAVAAYDGPVRRFVLAFKEEGVLALSRPLGWALARSVVAAAGPRAAVRLVPVPSSRSARRERGLDVVRRLATVAARDLRSVGIDVRVVPALRHTRRVQDSAGLTAIERAGNLAGAFTVTGPAPLRALAGRPVILVDDLITTGATLAECALALRRCGVEVVSSATIAATQRRRSG